MKKNLNKLRQKIDLLDKKIVLLLSERIKTALKISEIKEEKGLSFYSPEREAQILRRIKKLNPGIIPDETLEFLFTQIMSVTLSLSSTLKIAYLGPPATFTHLAALKKFGDKVELLPLDNIEEIFKWVENDKAYFGVVPVENSLEGAVTHTLDMFIDYNLKICSEIIIVVRHHLLSRSSLDKIKRVYSHHQVFGQCKKWLQENLSDREFISVQSTAKAAEIASSCKYTACIASEAAARVYKLKILANNIQDFSDNVTRFLVIGKYVTQSTGKDKTSLLFSVKDRVGALHDMLVPFKKNRINLTKIESRPSKRKPWEYYFFVDLEGHIKDKKVKEALEELEQKCNFLKVLGSYPQAS